MVSILGYNSDMISVELDDGTLGIIGYKKDKLHCFVCNKQCDHISIVKDRKNEELPAIKEFASVAAVSQRRYDKKCFSKKAVPFYIPEKGRTYKKYVMELRV